MSEQAYEPSDAFGLLRSYNRHVRCVQFALLAVSHELERRGLTHDLSKMLDDEFGGFARINAAARINKFGSPEYSEGMKREKATIDLHFSRNTHHPENPGMGLIGTEVVEYDAGQRHMSFFDVIEMVCDWWGARAGYDDPRSWADSVKLNLEKKGDLLTPPELWLAKEVAAFLESTQITGVRAAAIREGRESETVGNAGGGCG